MRRHAKRLLLGATALAVTAGATAAAFGTAQAEPAGPGAAADASAPALAEPNGPFGIGTTTLHLVDEDRADPWLPEEDRQLMVSMWFPTADQGETAAYMTAEESAVFVDQLGIDAPADYFASVETNAVADAEPVRGRLSLVMLSPGWSFPRATLTSLAEELASHGYAVAAVGHNYEAPTGLPDGTTNPCLACPTDPDGGTVTAQRAEDLSFVLDELTSRGSEWRSRIDRGHVAVGGHSIGGSGAHAAVQADDRFTAGFVLDSSLYDHVDAPVDEPFLLLGSEENAAPGGNDDWIPAWNQMSDWKRWIQVEQTTHSSFTDLAPFADDLGIPIQEMEGARAVELVRAYVTAFVDAHLRGEEAPVLDGPTETWPEAVFHSP
ncbi:alpha/beta hydrolase family protein [Glycomyces albidus]|uniref:Alpha/beta hydrolase n=1 Tax=Glycomyces albidus TaxID=2656774 RepID=A0A6L5G9W3_9ACTN|nr:alpha/beta hydrolase [Glycomyces albidus]MQM26363.1 alpha/beta hydrolase [Glycomyces albidus]